MSATKSTTRSPADEHEPEDDGLIPAVGYLRMSDDDQEGSIEQQRAVIVAWAAGRYRIIRWYIDAGKSASKDPEKRVEFRRMILDSGKGEFRAIVCWKSNRFARQDSQEGAADKLALRRAGVYVDTVCDGMLDWETMGGRIVDAVKSEMNHEYSVSLSQDSTRGRLACLESGQWCHGAVPYGYHRLYQSPTGQTVRVRRDEAFRKPKGWWLSLVVCDQEKAVVEWMAHKVLDHDAPLRQLALDLDRRGVPPPAVLGKVNRSGWDPYAIERILTCPAIAGVSFIGGRNPRRGKFLTRPVADVRKAGACPALLDPETFERLQAALAQRKQERRKPRTGTGALSGVLRCGHCGYRLATSSRGGKVFYSCRSSGVHPGRTRCHKWGVYEADVLPLLCARLVALVDGELVKAVAATPPATTRVDDLEMARQQLAALERQADQAADRYLRAPAATLARLKERLEALQVEVAEAEARVRQLAAAANDTPVSNFAAWWTTARERLLCVPLAEGSLSARIANLRLQLRGCKGEGFEMATDDYAIVEPAALRSLLLRLGVTAECWWKDTEASRSAQGKGEARFVLERAVLAVNGDRPGADDSSYPHDRWTLSSPHPGA
jgi:DNA invertase Pin-like site-specific DNA recombinase